MSRVQSFDAVYGRIEEVERRIGMEPKELVVPSGWIKLDYSYGWYCTVDVNGAQCRATAITSHAVSKYEFGVCAARCEKHLKVPLDITSGLKDKIARLEAQSLTDATAANKRVADVQSLLNSANAKLAKATNQSTWEMAEAGSTCSASYHNFGFCTNPAVIYNKVLSSRRCAGHIGLPVDAKAYPVTDAGKMLNSLKLMPAERNEIEKWLRMYSTSGSPDTTAAAVLRRILAIV